LGYFVAHQNIKIPPLSPHLPLGFWGSFGGAADEN